jgi:hypothetical protein
MSVNRVLMIIRIDQGNKQLGLGFMACLVRRCPCDHVLIVLALNGYAFLGQGRAGQPKIILKIVMPRFHSSFLLGPHIMVKALDRVRAGFTLRWRRPPVGQECLAKTWLYEANGGCAGEELKEIKYFY